MLRRFSIHHRLLGGFGLVLGLMSLVAAIAAFGFWISKTAVDRINERLLPATQAVGTLHTRLLESRILTTSMVAATLNGKEVTRLHAEFKAKQTALDQAASHLQSLVAEPQSLDKLAQFRTHLAEWRKAIAPTIATLEKDGFPDATEAGQEMSSGARHFDAALALMNEAESLLKTAGEAAMSKVQSAANFSAIALAIGFVAAVVCGAVLAWRISASIVQPIAQAVSLANAIAEGDLTNHGAEQSSQHRDEAALMSQALSRMQASLRQLVGQVLEAAQHIRDASREVASGNADLSTRTEHTASQLQQTANSMQQLSGSVGESADSAQQADTLASLAAQEAQQGGEVVAQVVSAMDDIHQRSRKIGEITAVIDGIAFQTNILALNAAVEAARAGEQGRGFAVVAGEVRGLASRAAEAAREIKALIGASVERVEDGARLVGDAGQKMGQIVGSVQRVSGLMAELTRTAQSQRQGIGDVSQAVTHLDDATQRNAALVEQSAAAAQSLLEHASRLTELVSVFRLEAAASAR